MPTPRISRNMRKRICEVYDTDPTATYESVAEIFGVGSATVGRILRCYRETVEVEPPPPRHVPRNKIDLNWLRAHAEAHPDARLRDRATAFAQATGIEVSIVYVHYAMIAIGYTRKKKRLWQRNVTPSAWPRSERRLSRSNLAWRQSVLCF